MSKDLSQTFFKQVPNANETSKPGFLSHSIDHTKHSYSLLLTSTLLFKGRYAHVESKLEESKLEESKLEESKLEESTQLAEQLHISHVG